MLCNLQPPSLLNSCLIINSVLCPQSSFFTGHIHYLYLGCAQTNVCFTLSLRTCQKKWKKKNEKMNERDRDWIRSAERHCYIAVTRGDPITMWRGVKCIHPLLGICRVLPPMASACFRGFNHVWNDGHVPSFLWPPRSRNHSTQVRPLPSDTIWETGQHVATSLICPCTDTTSAYKIISQQRLWNWNVKVQLRFRV